MNRRAPALLFVFVTLLLDALGIGLIIPVGPKLVEELGHWSDREAAPVVGWLNATYAILLFLCAPLLGALSDRLGRRPVLLVAMFGSGLDYLAMALAPSVAWLFVTRALNGISGASISPASAYIADITPPEKRAAGFGVIGAAFGLGFVLGPLVGGMLGDGHLRWPFYAAGAMALLNGLFGLLVLPESLPKEKRNPKPFSWNPFAALGVLLRYPLALRLGGALFLLNMAQFALHATWFFYCQRRYGWSPKWVGMSMFAVGIGAVIVQGGLARRLFPLIGEKRALLAGVACAVIAYLGYAFATAGWMIYVAIPISTLAGIAMPACQSLITKSVDPREQGTVQGGLSGITSLANIAGPLVGSRIYEAATAPGVDFPGLVYITSAALALLGWIVAAAALRSRHAAHA